MKKVLVAGVFLLGIVGGGIKIEAEERYITQKGSAEGFIYLYNEDISYLEKEIQELLNECREGVE